MSAANIPTAHHEAATVEDLIRYAHARFGAAGVSVSSSKVSRLVRKVYRAGGSDAAKLLVDGYIARADHGIDLDAWTTIYSDPTGNTATRNVDGTRAARDLIARGHRPADAARAAHLWEVADASA